MAGLANGSRRDFLKASAATAGSAALGPRAYARVRGANNRINFAVIGLGEMGSGHLRGLKRQMSQLNIDGIQARVFHLPKWPARCSYRWFGARPAERPARRRSSDCCVR